MSDNNNPWTWATVVMTVFFAVAAIAAVIFRNQAQLCHVFPHTEVEVQTPPVDEPQPWPCPAGYDCKG